MKNRTRNSIYPKVFQCGIILLFLFIINVLSCFSQPETGTLTDKRDGKTYKTVKIGGQWWMAENLNVGKTVKGQQAGLWQTNNGIIEKYVYEDDEKNADIYGGLYNWEEAMDYSEPSNLSNKTVQGICPCGWHIPSDEEWKLLEIALGMPESELGKSGDRGSDEGDKLKEANGSHWQDIIEEITGKILKDKGNNESGFTALPAGNRHNYNKIWAGKGTGTAYWTSSAEIDAYNFLTPYIRYVSSYWSIIGRSVDVQGPNILASYSVRCLKDYSANSTDGEESQSTPYIYPNPAESFVTIGDADHNDEYSIFNELGEKAIQIGNNQFDKVLRIDISSLPAGVYYLRYGNRSKMIEKLK